MAKIGNSNVFSYRITTSISQLRHPISFGGGGCFQFFTKNRPKKQQKRAILHTSQANGGARAPPGYTTGGVPQGSTLGPLLFIIYRNDLPLATKLQVRLFADDTNLTVSHHSENLLEHIVNTELQKISNWMKINKLSINCYRTEYIIIINKRKRAKFNLKIHNNIINQNTCVKYLGIMIDDFLKWESQIHGMCSKLASCQWMLCTISSTKICWLQYFNSLMMVYYSMIHSHLSYCISSWKSASKTILNSLDILQK